MHSWDEGLLDMCIGEKRTLTISPEKGYGQRAMGPIPAGSTLSKPGCRASPPTAPVRTNALYDLQSSRRSSSASTVSPSPRPSSPRRRPRPQPRPPLRRLPPTLLTPSRRRSTRRSERPSSWLRTYSETPTMLRRRPSCKEEPARRGYTGGAERWVFGFSKGWPAAGW